MYRSSRKPRCKTAYTRLNILRETCIFDRPQRSVLDPLPLKLEALFRERWGTGHPRPGCGRPSVSGGQATTRVRINSRLTPTRRHARTFPSTGGDTRTSAHVVQPHYMHAPVLSPRYHYDAVSICGEASGIETGRAARYSRPREWVSEKETPLNALTFPRKPRIFAGKSRATRSLAFCYSTHPLNPLIFTFCGTRRIRYSAQHFRKKCIS